MLTHGFDAQNLLLNKDCKRKIYAYGRCEIFGPVLKMRPNQTQGIAGQTKARKLFSKALQKCSIICQEQKLYASRIYQFGLSALL